VTFRTIRRHPQDRRSLLKRVRLELVGCRDQKRWERCFASRGATLKGTMLKIKFCSESSAFFFEHALYIDGGTHAHALGFYGFTSDVQAIVVWVFWHRVGSEVDTAFRRIVSLPSSE
jgi:hypothetical protein